MAESALVAHVTVAVGLYKNTEHGNPLFDN